MTPKHRAEINRRLAEYARFETDTWQRWAYNPPDYTADLNALARLEGKLPDHSWTISYIKGAPKSYLFIEDFPAASAFGPEAEARAEAIYLYLESRAQVKR